MKNIDTKQLLDELKDKLLHDHLNATQIIEVKNVFIKKHITPIYDELKLAPVNEKKELGNFVNIFKNQVNDLFDQILEQAQIEEENKLHIIDYDININSSNLTKGGLTPFSLLLQEVMEYFKRLNFRIVMGSEIVDTKYNFDHLNIDVNHPARSYQDSFFINKTTMLRTHCTAQTAMALENNKSEDIRIVTFGNVYRNDDDDATHSHQFNQIDLLWVKDGLSIRNLKWLIDGLLKHLFGLETKTRYRLSYFPFTEPSFEVDMTCTNCHGKGCSMCKQTGWIEILGAGMLHDNVLKAANVTIKTALAAGIGVDRLVMLKYGFNDIRDLYSNDLRIIDQFKRKG